MEDPMIWTRKDRLLLIAFFGRQFFDDEGGLICCDGGVNYLHFKTAMRKLFEVLTPDQYEEFKERLSRKGKDVRKFFPPYGITDDDIGKWKDQALSTAKTIPVRLVDFLEELESLVESATLVQAVARESYAWAASEDVLYGINN